MNYSDHGSCAVSEMPHEALLLPVPRPPRAGHLDRRLVKRREGPRCSFGSTSPLIALLTCHRDRLGTRRHTEFGQDRRDMVVDGLRRNEQALGYRRIAKTFG